MLPRSPSTIHSISHSAYSTCLHKIACPECVCRSTRQQILAFLESLYTRLGVEPGAISVANVVALLRAEPWMTEINAHVRQKTAIERSRKVLIRSDGGSGIGMGHLARCMELASTLHNRKMMGTIATNDDPAAAAALSAAGFSFLTRQEPEVPWLARCVNDGAFDAVVIDIRGDLSANALQRRLVTGRW